MTMQVGDSLFIILQLNDQKVVVGGSILAIYHGSKVVSVLIITLTIRLEAIVSQGAP